jgi:hypothetical protein
MRQLAQICEIRVKDFCTAIRQNRHKTRGFFKAMAAGLRSAGFQTCCVADFPVGGTSGSCASSGLGNPRYSRLGSLRYFGCGYAALCLLCFFRKFLFVYFVCFVVKILSVFRG